MQVYCPAFGLWCHNCSLTGTMYFASCVFWDGLLLYVNFAVALNVIYVCNAIYVVYT